MYYEDITLLHCSMVMFVFQFKFVLGITIIDVFCPVHALFLFKNSTVHSWRKFVPCGFFRSTRIVFVVLIFSIMFVCGSMVVLDGISFVVICVVVFVYFVLVVVICGRFILSPGISLV